MEEKLSGVVVTSPFVFVMSTGIVVIECVVVYDCAVLSPVRVDASSGLIEVAGSVVLVFSPPAQSDDITY